MRKEKNREQKEGKTERQMKCELEPATKQNIQSPAMCIIIRTHTKAFFLPATGSQWGFQAVWISNHFVQNANYLFKLWPFTAFLLPTIQHQLVQSCWAIHGCWQAIAFFDCFYNLVANIVNHFSSTVI